MSLKDSFLSNFAGGNKIKHRVFTENFQKFLENLSVGVYE